MSEASSAETIKKYTPRPPKQVSDAASNVDAMIVAQKNPPATPPANGNEPAPPAAPTAPTPPAPGTPPAPAQPPAQQRPPDAPPSAEPDAEQRYQSMKGRYDNQVRITTELTNRLTNLEQMIANMRAAGASPPAAPSPPPAPARLITPEEETEFGAELLDVAGRRAREVISPEILELRGQIASLTNRLEGVTQVTTQNAKERFYSDLDREISDWRTINRSQEFKDWLQYPDDFSGRRRHDLLIEAFNGHESDRVVRFFKGFTAATGTPPSQQPSPPTPGNVQAPPVVTSLEDLAAPGRARSAQQPPGVPAEKPTYTSAWFAQFMHDRLSGKWKGREAEALAIEADCFAAQKEGRWVN
jgi:hypothetical protein